LIFLSGKVTLILFRKIILIYLDELLILIFHLFALKLIIFKCIESLVVMWFSLIFFYEVILNCLFLEKYYSGYTLVAVIRSSPV